MSSPITAPAVAVRAEGLTKDYAPDWRGRRVRALAEVSFVVPAGTITALVGPNGSGKSTALRLVAGLARPTAGRLEIFGHAVAAALSARLLGYMPDRLAVSPDRRAGEWLQQWTEWEASAVDVDLLLADLGLAGAAARRFGELSLGQRQRLNLAQALLGQPRLLVLDEPAGGLDPRAVEMLAARLRRFRDYGGAVLLSSHFLPQLETLADEVVLLDAGRVVARVSPDQIRAAGGLHRLFLEATAA